MFALIGTSVCKPKLEIKQSAPILSSLTAAECMGLLVLQIVLLYHMHKKMSFVELDMVCFTR